MIAAFSVWLLALQDQAYKHSISSCLFNNHDFFDTNTVTITGGTGCNLSSGCWRPQNMHFMPSSHNCWEWWVQIQIGYISETTLIKMHQWVGRGPTPKGVWLYLSPENFSSFCYCSTGWKIGRRAGWPMLWWVAGTSSKGQPAAFWSCYCRARQLCKGS